MNDGMDFWRIWSTKDKIVTLSASLFLITIMGSAVFFWQNGSANIISWDTISELHEKTIAAAPYFLGDYSFSATSPLWYVTEKYAPSIAQVNTVAYHAFFVCLLAGVSFILSGLSRLRGIWFLAGALVLGAVLVSLRIENLFNAVSKWPFLIGFATAGLTYYATNLYAKKLSILPTILIWFGVWSVLILAGSQYAAINAPLVSLAAYGTAGALVITLLFIFLTSHEILQGLLWIVSNNSEKGKSSLVQILVIFAIFLLNAVIIFLENSSKLEKSAFIPAPIFIFILNSVLGIWGFKKIAEQRSWFSFSGVGLWLYLGMAIVAGGVIMISYATVNDPLFAFLEDFISISFLGMGICFAVYFAINFLPLVKAGLPFHKVIYKPPFSPLLFSRIVAVFVVIFFFSLKSNFSLFQIRSGLSNTKADFYLAEGDLYTAETYFKDAERFDPQNYKSNIYLASLASDQGNHLAALHFYRAATQRNADAFAVAGESRSLEALDMHFDAVFKLKEAIATMPENHWLFTNLAHLQRKAGAVDSTLASLDKARQICPKCPVENTNFLAFWIDNGKPESLLEMRSLSHTSKDNGYLANYIAIDRITGQNTSFSEFKIHRDSVLDVGSAAYLLNAVSNANTQNTTRIDGAAIRSLQNKNNAIFEELSWAFANEEFYRGDKLAGIKQLAFMTDSKSKLTPLYNQNLGLWFMQEGVVPMAIERLQAAGDTAAVNTIKVTSLQQEVNTKLREQAEKISQNLTLDNYEATLNRAPLNLFLVAKVSDMLAVNKKNLEAYNVAFYSLPYHPKSVELLETYIKRAKEMHMNQEVELSIAQLQRLKQEQAKRY